MREKMIKEIVDGSQLHPLTLFRAPPGMGKSSLLALLENYLEKQCPRPEVFRYSFLDFKNRGYTSLDEAWGPDWIDTHFKCRGSTIRYILLDELQVLYGKEAALKLEGVFKEHVNITNTLRVFGFTAKGELAIELNQLGSSSTSLYDVTPFRPSRVYGGDSLLFNPEEVAELIASFEVKAGFSLPSEATTILHNWTGGHPLHLRQLLGLIYDSWKRIDKPLTTRQLLWLLFSLQGGSVISGCRAAPNFVGMTAITKKYLHDRLLDAHTVIPFREAMEEDKKVIRDAINRGVFSFYRKILPQQWPECGVGFLSHLCLSTCNQFNNSFPLGK